MKNHDKDIAWLRQHLKNFPTPAKSVKRMGCLFGILFACSAVLSCAAIYMLFRLGWAAIEWLGRN